MRTGPPHSRMLPNLIVIGAQKCGTTSLHHYLARARVWRLTLGRDLERNWDALAPLLR